MFILCLNKDENQHEQPCASQISTLVANINRVYGHTKIQISRFVLISAA